MHLFKQSLCWKIAHHSVGYFSVLTKALILLKNRIENRSNRFMTITNVTLKCAHREISIKHKRLLRFRV